MNDSKRFEIWDRDPHLREGDVASLHREAKKMMQTVPESKAAMKLY